MVYTKVKCCELYWMNSKSMIEGIKYGFVVCVSVLVCFAKLMSFANTCELRFLSNHSLFNVTAVCVSMLSLFPHSSQRSAVQYIIVLFLIHQLRFIQQVALSLLPLPSHRQYHYKAVALRNFLPWRCFNLGEIMTYSYNEEQNISDHLIRLYNSVTMNKI